MAAIAQVSRVILKKVLAVETPEVYPRHATCWYDLVMTSKGCRSFG